MLLWLRRRCEKAEWIRRDETDRGTRVEVERIGVRRARGSSRTS